MIPFDTHQLTASDGAKIFYYSTPRFKDSRAAILLVHGMAEHASRYREFADFLCRRNLVVYAIDQRGHGATGLSQDSLGFFAETDGWQRIVSDIGELSTHIKSQHPELPLFILGHSMGSVAVRSALIRFGDLYRGAVVVGTTLGRGAAMRKLGKALARAEIAKFGPRHPSSFLNLLAFGGYNRHFLPARTAFDWLSANPDNVDAYIADPLCGFTCTAGFFYDLFDGIDFASDPKNIKKMPSSLPIFLVAGAADPVGGMGKEVLALEKLMKACGMTQVTCTLYPEKRHELLNEANRRLVYSEVLAFIEAFI
ncbi:MAG: alpha/beta hydrolase [Eubacterium sp.]|nr:alpha/beta hydrolase [Eubacterium sp.]